MTLASMIAPDADTRAEDVLRLRREIGRMQRRRSDLPLIPVPSPLEQILPDRGLQVGTTYAVSPSPGLIGALLSGSSGTGAWCAAVGMPTLGVEALAGHGVALDRLLLVPAPGPRWLSVVSALSEVIPLIAIRPSSSVRDAELSRLGARLRDRGCTLLVVQGGPAATGASGAGTAWPQSEGSLQAHDPHWRGLGAGWGALEECEVTITARTRRSPAPRSVRVRLPGVHGRLESVAHGSMAGGLGTVEAVAPPAPRLVPFPSAPAAPRPPAGAPALLAVAG